MGSPSTFSDCAETCAAAGWMMPCIADATDNDELTAIVDSDGETSAWLGYESPPDADSSDTANWDWISPQCASTYTNWYTGEPNDYGDAEDCAEFRAYLGAKVALGGRRLRAPLRQRTTGPRAARRAPRHGQFRRRPQGR